MFARWQHWQKHDLYTSLQGIILHGYMACMLQTTIAAVTFLIARSASAERPKSLVVHVGPRMRQHKECRLSLVFILYCLQSLRQSSAARPEDAVFIPGTLPLDDDGKEVLSTPQLPVEDSLFPIGYARRHGRFAYRLGPFLQVQAHGGGLLKVKDTWYWFGESYKRPLLGDFLSEGINLYSSMGEAHVLEYSCCEGVMRQMIDSAHD